jgi:glycosyltransferase involved in cell wall biosynthesis
MTAAHFSLGRAQVGARETIRAELGIPPDAIVIGIAGRLLVDSRHGYCYGLELIRALRRTDRADLRVLIVGDGDGLPTLTSLAGNELGRRVLLTGGVQRERVPDYLAAMDIGALSQSTDLVGALRYTTKLPEYLAAGLPVVAGEIPAAYDLDTGWLWRLPGDAPWVEEHIAALAQLMESVSLKAIATKKAQVPRELELFNSELQQQRVCAFVRETVARAKRQR